MRLFTRIRVGLAIAGLAALPSLAGAQGGRAVIPPRRQAARQAMRAERQSERDSAQPGAGDRTMLQRQVRQAFAQTVRRQLRLNDQQMRNLSSVNAKYDRQRAEILRGERDARLGLKAAMEDSTAADQSARVEQQLNLLVQAQRRRADLLENEQKELSGFLTPLQRAQFYALQERLTKRLQELRQQNAPAGPPPPDVPDPTGTP